MSSSPRKGGETRPPMQIHRRMLPPFATLRVSGISCQAHGFVVFFLDVKLALKMDYHHLLQLVGHGRFLHGLLRMQSMRSFWF